MSHQIFGTGHLGPDYRPSNWHLGRLDTLKRSTPLDNYRRAPWAHPCPLRFHVGNLNKLPIAFADGPRIWAALPITADALEWRTRTYGRRTIELPECAELAATWREAMDYATTGIPPRPLEYVYPDWCGLPHGFEPGKIGR